jgi:hypothetical protein
LLLDPTVDDPYDHIAFVPETGQYQGLTQRGEQTVRVFGLNRRGDLERGRRNVWTELSALFLAYQRARRARDTAQQRRLREVVKELSFQSVVQHFLRDALAARGSVPPGVASAVRATRSDWEWAL